VIPSRQCYCNSGSAALLRSSAVPAGPVTSPNPFGRPCAAPWVPMTSAFRLSPLGDRNQGMYDRFAYGARTAQGRLATVACRHRFWLPFTTEEPTMEKPATAGQGQEPWNNGKLVGQKSPLKLKDMWAIRI
jgi:hypothetical protein